MLISTLLESTDAATNDLLRLLVGDHLGRGCSRHVFALRHNDSMVIKIERSSYDFQNIREHDLWEWASINAAREWLAPVKCISPCGTCLLMARTEPVAVSQLPVFVPDWLTDTKPDNWGRLGDRVVCHDYGFHTAFVSGIGNKVRRADWAH